MLYSVIGYLLLPVILLYLARRMLKSKDYRQGFWQRLGFIRGNFNGCIHIHCASLGEVNAAKNLIEQLINTYPKHTIVITNSTPTGAAQVEHLFGSKVTQLMAPIDVWGASRRFSKKLSPSLSVFTEVEIWPNWLLSLNKQNTTLVMVNARLSEKSFKRYQSLAALFNPVIGCFSWIGCQSDQIASRYSCLSANKVSVTGNLKFDLQINPDIAAKVSQLTQLVTATRPIWVGASVHPGEYEQVINAHLKIVKQKPDALLVLVPRHPEQFNKVAEYLTGQNIQFVSRTKQTEISSTHSVWLVDTLGELMSFYALAEIAFVGGSLVDRGGHNPLEPAALAKPVVMGPYQVNCLDICQALQDKRALATIDNANELAEVILRLWSDPNLYQQAAVAASEVVMINQGATLKTLSAIKKIQPALF
ncbi:lipid IV(A) 3-deoxy-D-manno-octulosonic acid transferase [Catenovulum sp. 2E275]|nr:lipid IV(A) 3-deoxy-D-manno-octulosonic acid transferase [Catenovulum sp. 2E275]